MKHGISRRRLISSVAAAGVFASGSRVVAQQATGVRGFDHVALPMERILACGREALLPIG